LKALLKPACPYWRPVPADPELRMLAPASVVQVFRFKVRTPRLKVKACSLSARHT
jgi:hypothetical protein